MPIVPLLKTRNYFISTEGCVFKIENGKEVLIQPYRASKSKDVFVKIDTKAYNLLYLMIQHFIGDIKLTDKIKFTINKDLYIPLTSIRIKSALGISNFISPKDEAKLYNFKCDVKAYSANNRCIDKITSFEVFQLLSGHDFKCVYCMDILLPNSWQLDHFKSIFSGGKNVFENLVPSCATCNIMKGTLEGNQFYALCGKIYKNYMFKESLEKQNLIGRTLTQKTA